MSGLRADNIGDCLEQLALSLPLLVVQDVSGVPIEKRFVCRLKQDGLRLVLNELPDEFSKRPSEWGTLEFCIFIRSLLKARPFELMNLPSSFAANGLDLKKTYAFLVLMTAYALYDYGRRDICESCGFENCADGKTFFNDCVVLEVNQQVLLMSGKGAKATWFKYMAPVLRGPTAMNDYLLLFVNQARYQRHLRTSS